MQRKKGWLIKQSSLIILIILCMTAPTIFAGDPIDDGFGFTLDAGWYGSIPGAFHQDALPLRSHLTLGGSVTPVILGFGNKLELAAGISSYYVTHSMIYGATVWRPFFTIGPFFNLTFHIDEHFSISPGVTLLAGFYTQTKDFTPILRLSVTPGYALPTNFKRNQWVITLPINVDLRTDYVSVAAGFGITWRFDKKKQEKL